MADPDTRLFASIDSNVRIGTLALTHTLLQAKAYTARDRPFEAITMTRVSALLLAAQYEARLNWLVWNPASRLVEAHRIEALSGGFANRWRTLLKLALRQRVAEREADFNPPLKTLVKELPRSYRSLYFNLEAVRRKHLDPLVDNRNSLAHGEWVVALNREASAVNVERTRRIQNLTLFHVVTLSNLLDHFWKCYFDALVTRQAFERDFTVHNQRMMHAARRLTTADEGVWLGNLRRRFKDGRSSHGGLSFPPFPYGGVPSGRFDAAGRLVLGGKLVAPEVGQLLRETDA